MIIIEAKETFVVSGLKGFGAGDGYHVHPRSIPLARLVSHLGVVGSTVWNFRQEQTQCGVSIRPASHAPFGECMDELGCTVKGQAVFSRLDFMQQFVRGHDRLPVLFSPFIMELELHDKKGQCYSLAPFGCGLSGYAASILVLFKKHFRYKQMKMPFKLPLIALLLSACLTANADDSAIIGEECAASNSCVTQAFKHFYAKILPMKLTPAITLTDFVIREDISVASVLLTQTRGQLIETPAEARELSSTLDQYARQMTCGVSQGIEQYYLRTGGQIIWKYYFSDGEYFDSRAFSGCN